MSRIGSLPISVPRDVKINIEDNEVTVEGSKGKLSRLFPRGISITLKDENLVVDRPSNSKNHRALHGLSRSLLANMVEGVTKGFEKVLEINGIGYRAQKEGDKLSLQIGFSHLVDFVPSPGIDIVVEGTNRIRVIGIDKELVGETAAKIRAIRPPDPYKGKGIRYVGEKIRLKPGKSGKISMRK